MTWPVRNWLVGPFEHKETTRDAPPSGVYKSWRDEKFQAVTAREDDDSSIDQPGLPKKTLDPYPLSPFA